MFESLTASVNARSTVLLFSLDRRLNRIMLWWLGCASLASAARLALTPAQVPTSMVSTSLSYALLIGAPLVSTLLALRWFADGDCQPQPATRLAVISRWTKISRDAAKCHRLYGAGGLMVSLLVGMMMNVPIRTAEYLAAMPPMPSDPPRWLTVLHLLMTLDAVAFTSLYMIAFVAALRRVPLFPRLLVAIWLSDLAMQVVTAQLVAGTDLPPAVAHALQSMLTGNVKKVLISASLWLPYLLLSTRVNVTYRHRLPMTRA